MRVAMFEGYHGSESFGDAQADAVEELIRANVTAMQGIQTSLWNAHSQWQQGRWLTGVLFPPSILLRIGSFDWGYAVNAWQESIDTWWSPTLTDAVRSDPYAVGQDGKTRVQSWIDMATHLITWAQDTAGRMADDTLASDVAKFGESFKTAVRMFVNAGGKIVLSGLGALPDWLKWGAAGLLGLVLFERFTRR